MVVGDRRKGQVVGKGEVPVELRRLWGLEGRSRLGRPAELDVERVLRAAVALADRSGLPGVTLPRIAKVLGYSTMSLYRYVGSKGALLSLLQDFAIGPPPEIASRPGQWREGLRQWARAERVLNHRRPWLARLPIAGPPIGPNAVAWMETGLRILRGTGLGWAEKLGLLTLISGYVRQTSLLSQDLERGRTGAGLDEAQAAQRYGRSLATLIGPDKFPETARLLAARVFESSRGRTREDPTAGFTFGLERILDGISVAVARVRRTR